MATPLNILLIEDQQDDADLVIRAIKKAGYAPNSRRVYSSVQLKESLATERWDLIISDHNLPGFNSFGALKVLKESGLDIPFLIVSGTIGEEVAVEAMKAGAQDYIMKTNLTRRIPAIERELKEARDRQNSREAARSLKTVEENFRLFVESAKDYAIVILDVEGRVIGWNPGAERIFGYHEEQILGRPMQLFYMPEDRLTHLPETNLRKAVEVGRVESERWQMRQNQTSFWGSGILTSLRDDRDQLRGFVLIMRDMTLRKQAELEMLLAREAAEAANEAKSNFLANVSHELRTPLSAILGFVDLLQEMSASPSDKNDFIDTIRRNAEQLVRLIDDLLDITKVESGHLSLEKRRIDLESFLGDVLVTLKIKAQEKNIRLQMLSSSKLPEFIETDPTRLRQILFNVIGNAVKFTEVGGVNVFVRLDEETLVFQVKDTGIGMSPEQQTKVFQPFVQADGSMSRRFGGTGLGLVLSKTLAEALGGRLVLRASTLGQGSEFEIRLPSGDLRKVPLVDRMDFERTRREQQTPRAASSQELAGVRVLLVEDAPDNQFLVNRYLRAAGAQVTIANDGLEGVEKALGAEFDVILMDLQMPRMDGYAATRRLRELGYTGPILALSAHAMEEEKVNSLGAGCDDHLTKPINRGTLLVKVREYARGIERGVEGFRRSELSE